jgi:hypothetical protein
MQAAITSLPRWEAHWDQKLNLFLGLLKIEQRQQGLRVGLCPG